MEKLHFCCHFDLLCFLYRSPSQAYRKCLLQLLVVFLKNWCIFKKNGIVLLTVNSISLSFSQWHVYLLLKINAKAIKNKFILYMYIELDGKRIGEGVYIFLYFYCIYLYDIEMNGLWIKFYILCNLSSFFFFYNSSKSFIYGFFFPSIYK